MTFQTKVGTQTQIVRWVYQMGLEAYKRKEQKRKYIHGWSYISWKYLAVFVCKFSSI